MSKEEFDLIYPYMPKSGKLLEIGSYPFERTQDLMDLGYQVTGYDLNYNRTEYHTRKVDVEKDIFPGMNNEYDIVLMMQVLEHLGRNPLHALKEIKRVLKPEGVLVLSTPNFFNLRNFSTLIFKGYQHEFASIIKHDDYTGHIRTYTRKELKMLLEHCGFRVKYMKFLFYKKDLWTVGGLITKLIPRCRDHLLVICEVEK